MQSCIQGIYLMVCIYYFLLLGQVVMPPFQLSKDDAKHLLEDFFWDDEQEVQDVTSTLKRQIIEAANATATATAPAAIDTGKVSTWRKLPASMLIKGSNLQKLNKFKEKDDDELEQDEFADEDLWTNDLNSTRTRSFDFDLASRLKRQLMEHATQSSQQEVRTGLLSNGIDGHEGLL